MLGAAVLAALLALAAVVVFLMQPDTAGPTATPPIWTTSSPPAPAATVIPTSAPSGITWSLVGQTAVPASATDGPAKVTGCKATGYAHTPIGALVAAVQISTRSGFYAGRSCWEPAITAQFVASADRDTLLGLLKQADVQGQPGAAPGELSQVAAFRYTSYTSDTAVIGLIRRTPQGSFAQTILTLTWIGDDWKLVAPAGGQWPAGTTSLSSLTGATAWGAA
ncbi:MAG TPA: hypothetical protein DGG94_14220 [Micromonosporaceae bacterium]|nr:hypothetical protein [Micromonosporaceae bacterium]HCU50931.1 hypothetical protein [Micromonosporaceae bacterium]